MLGAGDLLQLRTGCMDQLPELSNQAGVAIKHRSGV
jgi:hypothetical protein